MKQTEPFYQIDFYVLGNRLILQEIPHNAYQKDRPWQSENRPGFFIYPVFPVFFFGATSLHKEVTQRSLEFSISQMTSSPYPAASFWHFLLRQPSTRKVGHVQPGKTSYDLCDLLLHILCLTFIQTDTLKICRGRRPCFYRPRTSRARRHLYSDQTYLL